jgi:hypothetical protein
MSNVDPMVWFFVFLLCVLAYNMVMDRWFRR